MIYLDNAATTFPKPESVYIAMDKINREGAVNAGRGSYKLARNASQIIKETKDLLRNLVHVDSSAAVVFSPSVTIALNQIVNGLDVADGSVIYVSPYEHNAVARTIYDLSQKKRITIKELPINSEYEIDIERMKYEFIKDKPTILFCTHVSNVTGYILPIAEIFSESKKYNCINILDSAQSLGLVDLRADLISVDIIAFAGHKTLYGPFGIGGFINLSRVNLDVVVTGGTGSDSLNLEMPTGSEARYEASSSNIVAIAGLNAALREIDCETNYRHEKDLSDYFINQMNKKTGVVLYLPGKKDNHVGIISFNVNGYKAEDIGVILDEEFDIAVRTGYHCAPYIHKYLKDDIFLGTVRVGLGQFNTKEDIDKLIEAIEDL